MTGAAEPAGAALRAEVGAITAAAIAAGSAFIAAAADAARPPLSPSRRCACHHCVRVIPSHAIPARKRACHSVRVSVGSRAFPLLVWSERQRAGQRLRVDDCYGWPIGADVSRSNGTPRWEARGSMLRWTFAVWVPPTVYDGRSREARELSRHGGFCLLLEKESVESTHKVPTSH